MHPVLERSRPRQNCSVTVGREAGPVPGYCESSVSPHRWDPGSSGCLRFALWKIEPQRHTGGVRTKQSTWGPPSTAPKGGGTRGADVRPAPTSRPQPQGPHLPGPLQGCRGGGETGWRQGRAQGVPTQDHASYISRKSLLIFFIQKKPNPWI